MTCLDDATVLGLVEGRLAPAALADVDAHIDTCESCRSVVTLVASTRTPSRVLARGDKLGRFEIRELLGTGAMGRVYSAFEPELDRHVAIKVLIEDGGTARDRLVKEAQAMARLAHPNVMTVHEVGTTEAGVFVAMELVDGETLRAWAQSPRPWREVVPMLVEIGRGLAAVHAAGVVHRDVKPDNMIVGSDGRVRLGDFGLARSTHTPAITPSLAMGTDTTVAGTPAYMAPEVLRGDPATAASDQFSFGVMAYELLAGRRPFVGATWADLLAATVRGDAPPLRDAPSWLDAALRRCLAVAPTTRFPSLRGAADALAAGLAPRRRPGAWIAGALGVAALASVGTWTLVNQGRAQPRACDLALPDFQVDMRTREGEAVVAWSQAWRDERADACRASTLSPARMQCLDQRRAELASLVPRLVGPRALDAIATLPPPSECRAATTNSSSARAIGGELAALRAAIALGEPALGATELVVARARNTDHAPTLAEALLVHAEALRGVDRLGEAAIVAREATAAATRGHADLVGARAWLARVAIAGERRELDSADDVGMLAVAAVERIGSPKHLVATLSRLRGLIAYNRGHLADARTLLLDARAHVVPDSLEAAAIESALGSVARAAGNLDEAQRHHEAAYAVDRTLRGETHRDIARDLHNLAGVLRLRGDLHGALTKYEAALAIEVATQGERSIAAGLTRNSLGLVRHAQGDLGSARIEHQLALDILTAANHGDRAFARHNLGLVAQSAGDHRTALAHFDRAAALYTATIGDQADAAVRLVDDRAKSLAALRPGAGVSRIPKLSATDPTPPPPAATDPAGAAAATPAVPAPPAPTPTPPKPKDIGVYGSAQPW